MSAAEAAARPDLGPWRSDAADGAAPGDAPGGGPFVLGPQVAALAAANEELLRVSPLVPRRHALPSREAIVRVVDDLRAALFPAHFGAGDLPPESLGYYIGHTLSTALPALQEQVRRGLQLECPHGEADCAACGRRAAEVARAFAAGLPAIRALLGGDLRAAFEGDPAATSVNEALFCYPGITALIHHRLAHALHGLGAPLIPRIIAELSHGRTGIDIHPGARIGGHFFIDHGTGVVIGETCLIGERVRLYQGVTLGAKRFALDGAGRPIKGTPRHPIVEDDVIIYAGATILGRITIGRGSSIGGNVWLTRSVQPGSRVTQAQACQNQFEDGLGI